jgi:Uma2 family endonuclease
MNTTTHLMTAEELIRLPRDRYRYELVKGELLTMSPSEQHGVVTVYLTAPLATHVRTNKLGIVFGAETGYILERNPDTVLAPDISFISNKRIETIPSGYLEIPPDLAVEVISPGESKAKVERKTAQWLALGAKDVWLVDPHKKTVEVYSAEAQTTVFHEADELVDYDLVPGFGVPVSEIFA